MKALFLAACIATSLYASGQLVRGEALLKGEGTITLRDSVQLTATDLRSGSYAAVRHARVHRDFISVADSAILKGGYLVWDRTDTLGMATADFSVDTLWPSTERRMSKYYEVVVSGRVAAEELHRRSFPTVAVEYFFQDNRGAVHDPMVEALTALGWERADVDEYEVWSYMDRHTRPDQPRFLALMLFRSGIPYVLINQGASFEYDKVKAVETRSTGTYYFFQRPNERFTSAIEDIVYSYLPL